MQLYHRRAVCFRTLDTEESSRLHKEEKEMIQRKSSIVRLVKRIYRRILYCHVNSSWFQSFDFPFDELNKRDIYGQTSLFCAALHNDRDAIRDLHAAGADINVANNDGRTPLWAACNAGHLGAVKLLTELGADLSQSDYGRRSPFFVAAHRGKIDILRLLHEIGAQFHHLDNASHSPLDIALHSYHLDCIVYLTIILSPTKNTLLSVVQSQMMTLYSQYGCSPHPAEASFIYRIYQQYQSGHSFIPKIVDIADSLVQIINHLERDLDFGCLRGLSSIQRSRVYTLAFGVLSTEIAAHSRFIAATCPHKITSHLHPLCYLVNCLSNKERVVDTFNLRIVTQLSYQERRFSAFTNTVREILEPDLIESYVGGSVARFIATKTFKIALDCIHNSDGQ